MRRAFRLTLRFAVIAVLFVMLVPSLSHRDRSFSPYDSSLSNLAIGSVYAANTCNNKHCSHNGKGGPKCVSGGVNLDCHVVGSACQTAMCV